MATKKKVVKKPNTDQLPQDKRNISLIIDENSMYSLFEVDDTGMNDFIDNFESIEDIEKHVSKSESGGVYYIFELRPHMKMERKTNVSKIKL